MFYINWIPIYNCPRMSAVILSSLYDALRDTVYVGMLDITDLIYLLSILLHFDGKQLRVLNHLVDETISF